MKRRHGQAALEFLTTYGWAFLILLVMIGAIAYFGFLRPEKFLPDRCLAGAEFSCKDYRIDATANTVTLLLNQQLGKTIWIAGSTCTFSDITPAVSISGVVRNQATVLVTPAAWSPRDPYSVTCTFGGSPLTNFKDKKVKVAFNLTYTTTSGGLLHTVDGEVYAEAQ